MVLFEPNTDANVSAFGIWYARLVCLATASMASWTVGGSGIGEEEARSQEFKNLDRDVKKTIVFFIWFCV